MRGRKLDKLGLRGQDTSEIFFQDCRVPAANLLGKEGQGFRMLMEKLQQERLCIAVASIASCRRALDDTVAYVKERRAFGQPIAAFQNTQFKLAELATEVEIGQAFVDRLLGAHVRGDDVVKEVSMAKWWTTDLQKRLTAECLQLHGGYGFMLEYPIAMRLRGRRGAVDLRRHQRDHEGDHRAAHGARLSWVAYGARAADGEPAHRDRSLPRAESLACSGRGRSPRMGVTWICVSSCSAPAPGWRCRRFAGARVESLTGTYEGKLMCKGADDGLDTKSKQDVSVEVLDMGAAASRSSSPTVGTLIGFAITDARSPRRARSRRSTCTLDGSRPSPARAPRRGQGKAGSDKATLKGDADPHEREERVVVVCTST